MSLSPPGSAVRSARRLSPPQAEELDFDFALRKAHRLQTDLAVISDELTKARLRLRRAEDFQIKYQLILKQKAEGDQRILLHQKQIFDLRAQIEEMSLTIKDKKDRNEVKEAEKINLMRELQMWKERCLDSEERAKMIAVEEQKRFNDKLEHEVALLKRAAGETEQELKFQLARAQKHLSEKTNIEHLVLDKNDKWKKQKESEVNRLEKVVQKSRETLLETIQEKNRQIQRVRHKFEQMFNDEISHLHKNMASQDGRFNLQLAGLKAIIEMKNQEIKLLQNQNLSSLNQFSKQRQALNEQIQSLREKIYQIELQSAQQIANVKQRLTKVHAIDLQGVKNRYEELIAGLKNQRENLQKQNKQRQDRYEKAKKQFEKSRQQLQNINKEKDGIIKQLKEKHEYHGASNTNQINNLHESLSKIQLEKQLLSSEYKSNIQFLNHQIGKLIASSELKNNEIKELHEYIATLKKEHFQVVKDLQQRWKNQRKQRQAQRERERQNRERIQQDLRTKEKHWRNKQREHEHESQKERRQKNQMALTIEQLEKDLQRVIKESIQHDEAHKRELGKNTLAAIGTGGIRRQLANEIQKQKLQLQQIKRMEIDQLRKRYELQIDRLNNQVERLKNDLTSKSIAFQNLEEEMKKITNLNKNMDRISKDKIIEYQKKMAALNSQILLTQNLYHSFLEAKSRVVKKQ